MFLCHSPSDYWTFFSLILVFLFLNFVVVETFWLFSWQTIYLSHFVTSCLQFPPPSSQILIVHDRRTWGSACWNVNMSLSEETFVAVPALLARGAENPASFPARLHAAAFWGDISAFAQLCHPKLVWSDCKSQLLSRLWALLEKSSAR